MVRRGRSSILKRYRENEKRERTARKAEKAAVKRERRLADKNAQTDAPADDDQSGELATPDQAPPPLDSDRA